MVVLDRHPSREQSAVLGSRRHGTQRMLGPLPSPFATPVTCGLREGVLGHIVQTLAQVEDSMAVVQEEDVSIAEARDVQLILLQQRYKNALQEIESLQKDLQAVRAERDSVVQQLSSERQLRYSRGAAFAKEMARPRSPKDVEEVRRLREALRAAEADLEEIEHPSSGVVDVPTLEAVSELPDPC